MKHVGLHALAFSDACVSGAQDVEAYLTGASDTSDFIQLALPELVLPGLPSRPVRISCHRSRMVSYVC